jgi:hypothetical protein
VDDSSLPTWPEIEAHALRHLHAARNEMSDVRDWLRSDWRPAGSPLTDPAANARTEIVRAVAEVQAIIDRAKNLLERDHRG